MTDDADRVSQDPPVPDPDDGGGRQADEDPFADLDDPPEGAAADLFDRLGEPDEADPFTEMDLEVHPEGPGWDDDGAPPAGAESLVPEVREPAPDLAVATGEKEAVVDKARYCESCEFFSDPPEVACSHPGTEIRELVDADHLTVYACPVVGKRRGYDWYEGDDRR